MTPNIAIVRIETPHWRTASRSGSRCSCSGSRSSCCRRSFSSSSSACRSPAGSAPGTRSKFCGTWSAHCREHTSASQPMEPTSAFASCNFCSAGLQSGCSAGLQTRSKNSKSIPIGEIDMNENRRQILEMLAAGKITAAEAERLLAAIEPEQTTTSEFTGRIPGNGLADSPVKTRAKYIRVLVEADEEMTGMKGPTTVNVRVPMQLLRAGVRLASLIPKQAHDQLRRSAQPSRHSADAFADQAGESRRADRPPRRSHRRCGRQGREQHQGPRLLRVEQGSGNRDQWAENSWPNPTFREQRKRRLICHSLSF